MNYRSLGRLMLVTLVMFALTAVCEACPTCKNAISDDPQQANMVRGYFWSILFMMSMPFLIFGSLGTYFYLQVRRARATQSTRSITAQSTSAHANAGQSMTSV